MKEIVEKIIAYIIELPMGAELSIREVFDELYLSQGYRWVCKKAGGGWMCSKDDGATYLLREEDLFQVQEEVEDSLEKAGVMLDYSKWDGMCVGMPYCVSFVRR